MRGSTHPNGEPQHAGTQQLPWEDRPLLTEDGLRRPQQTSQARSGPRPGSFPHEAWGLPGWGSRGSRPHFRPGILEVQRLRCGAGWFRVVVTEFAGVPGVPQEGELLSLCGLEVGPCVKALQAGRAPHRPLPSRVGLFPPVRPSSAVCC